ncbi:class I SAM-dependent methyltransferase [Qipengyuania mesophila]|uniref:class I SAM-dependent methyltransferase n=1 Tax=Qipengyuania mesophila TaxID=2867246 RepID=UPI003511C3CD
MDRLNYWIEFINSRDIKAMAEVGVWRGHFAEAILQNCPKVEKYYLIDPWKTLGDWNKPLNDDDMEDALAETQRRIEPFKERCHILRGRTTEVANELPELDFSYIDGDHTLRGISVDLIQIWPKIRDNGWVGGDDFTSSIWQHSSSYEPSLVFPFAVHFAEGVQCPITAPGSNQFYIVKSGAGFRFDQDGDYGETELLSQFSPSRLFGLSTGLRRRILGLGRR